MSGQKRKVVSLAIAAVLGLILLLGVVLSLPSGDLSHGIALAADEQIAAADNHISLGDEKTLHWAVKGTTTDSTSNLRDGRVYEYMYKGTDKLIHFYYSIARMDQCPNPAWTEWRIIDTFNVKFSIMRFRNSTFDHEVVIHSDLLGSSDADTNKGFWVEYKNEDKYTNTAKEPGQYMAKVVLHAIGDYEFTLTETTRATLSERGMDIIINPESNGKEATITKVWYIANFDNALLNGDESIAASSEVEYMIPSWTYGDDITIPYPWLYHGDGALKADMELNGGYMVKVREGSSDNLEDYTPIITDISLPERVRTLDLADAWDPRSANQLYDIVTFTLTSADGLTNYTQGEKVRSKWAYYINKYMPVGNYALTIHVKDISLTQHKHWWDGTLHEVANENESIYRGFKRTFNFTVKPGALSISETSLEAIKNHTYDTEFSNLVYSKDGTPTEGYFGLFQTDNLTTPIEYVYTKLNYPADPDSIYWTDPKETPHLEYNLARMYSDKYTTATDITEWSGWVKEPSTYKVYFMAKMTNYETYPSMADRYESFYEVVVYQEVDVPELNTYQLTYTGAELAVEPVHHAVKDAQADARNRRLYDWDGVLGTNVGDYTVTFTFNDPVHYKWSENSLPAQNAGEFVTEGGVKTYQIKWEITHQIVPIPEVATRIWQGEGIDVRPASLKAQFNNILGQNIFDIIHNDSKYIANGNKYSIAGDYDITLTLASTNYKWTDKDPSVQSITVTYTLSKATNFWASTPRIVPWIWGSYDKDKNIIEGAPVYGNVLFSIKQKSSNGSAINLGDIYLGGFNLSDGVVSDDVATALSGLNAGEYYLCASVAEGENYKAISDEARYAFKVEQMHNYWEVVPNIIRWKYGSFDKDINIITGKPNQGKNNIVYSILSSKGSVNSSDDHPIAGLAGISIDDNGVIQGANALDIISHLAGGTNNKYYLKVFVPADLNNNYTELLQYVEFFIQPVNNYWVTTPNITRWIYGSDPNLPMGEPRWGRAEFTITRDHDTAVVFDSKNDINRLGKEFAKAGWYTLNSKVAGTDSYTELNSTMRFQIFTTDVNYWIEVPNIQSWVEGSEACAPVARAAFGDMQYRYYAKDVYESVKNDHSQLLASALPDVPTAAGEYVMLATAISSEHPELVGVVNFSIVEKSKDLTPVYVSIIAVLAVLTAIGVALTVLFAKKSRRAPKPAAATADAPEQEFAEADEVNDDEIASDAQNDYGDDDDPDVEVIEPTYID